MARRAYLSGGMEYAADEGRDWRSEMQSWLERGLGCTVFNPNVESDRLLGTEYRGTDFRERHGAARFIEYHRRSLHDGR